MSPHESGFLEDDHDDNDDHDSGFPEDHYQELSWPQCHHRGPGQCPGGGRDLADSAEAHWCQGLPLGSPRMKELLLGSPRMRLLLGLNILQ